MAAQHAVGRVRWWPPTVSSRCLDLLIESAPSSLPAFRRDLERALGCRVAIYLPGQIPGGILVETVPL